MLPIEEAVLDLEETAVGLEEIGVDLEEVAVDLEEIAVELEDIVEILEEIVALLVEEHQEVVEHPNLVTALEHLEVHLGVDRLDRILSVVAFHLAAGSSVDFFLDQTALVGPFHHLGLVVQFFVEDLL